MAHKPGSCTACAARYPRGVTGCPFAPGPSSARQHYSHAPSRPTSDVPYPTYAGAIAMPYRPAKVGDAFGPSWTTHWFRVRATVPADWDGQGPLMFR